MQFRFYAQHFLTLLFSMLLFLTGCYNPDDYTLTQSDVDKLLSLKATNGQTSVQADGFSRIRLVAQYLSDFDESRQTILFTTSEGSFDSQEDVKEATVQVDPSGNAYIELRSSTSIGTASVQAQVEGVDGLLQQLTINFVQVDSGDIVYFIAAPRTAKADGITLSTFSVAINSGVPADQRMVAFKTTAGTFAGSGSTEETVDASSGNVATVQLKSPASPSVAQISASVGGVTSQASITFTGVAAGDIIEFSNTTASAPADGATRSPFVIEVSNQVPAEQRIVAFKTTAGTFAISGGPEETVQANASRQAFSQLISPLTITTARVSATLGSVTRETNIRFTRALPDKAVQVRAEPIELVIDPTKAGPQASIIVQMIRNVGTVTPGTSVVFNAYKSGSTASDKVGFFSNLELSDDQGQALAVYVPGSTSYRGDVIITARAENTDLVGTTTVRIVDPPIEE